MNKKDLIKQLEQLEFHDVNLKSHQRRLKMALMPREKDPKHPYYFIFQPMSVLKKAVPLAIIAVLALSLTFGAGNFFRSTTVSAQEVVQQTLADISELNPQTPEEKEKWGTVFETLQKALQSKELKYLNEERQGNILIKKLSFSNEDLDQSVVLRVVQIDGKLNNVHFDFDPILYNRSSSQIEAKIEHGVVINAEELSAQLQDPSLTQDWTKKLIQSVNKECAGMLAKIPENSEAGTTRQEKNSKALLPFIQSATMLVDCGISYPSSQNESFHVRVHQLGNQKKMRAEAQTILNEAMQVLKSDNAPEATLKIQLLEKAKKADDLRYQNNFGWTPQNGTTPNADRLSFTDPEFSPQPIFLYFEKGPKVEVSFEFSSGEIPAEITKLVTIPVQNGQVQNLGQFKDLLLPSGLNKELIVKLLVQPQNKNIAQSSSELNKKIQPYLEQIAASSEIMVYPTFYTEDENNEITSIVAETYSFGTHLDYVKNPEAYKIDRKKLLDAMLAKLSTSKSQDAQAKMEIVQHLENAKKFWKEPLMHHEHPTGILKSLYNSVDFFGNPRGPFKAYESYSFILDYNGRDLYVGMLYDPTDNSESGVEVGSMFFSDNIVKTHVGTYENGHITDLEVAKKVLKSEKALPSWIKWLISNQNKQTFQKEKLEVINDRCTERQAFYEQLKAEIDNADVQVNFIECNGNDSGEYKFHYYSFE